MCDFLKRLYWALSYFQRYIISKAFAMDKIRQLPSILVPQSREEGSDMVDRDTGAPIGSIGQRAQNLPNWLRCLWHIFSIIYAYGKLLSDAPIDLLCKPFLADVLRPVGGSAENESSAPSLSQDSFDSTPDPHNRPYSLGSMALHPILPLLAVVCSQNAEVLLYNIESMTCLQAFGYSKTTMTFEDPRTASISGALYVTCLQFSTGNQIAAGLSNGMVHFIEYDGFAMINPANNLKKPKNSPITISIGLLPVKDPHSYTRLVGRVTNLTFSPISVGAEDGSWLAIATERAGIWIWNKRNNQALRVVSTAGMNEGCLHWISVEEKPAETSVHRKSIKYEEKHLSASTVNRWSNIFGNSDDISALDECFATSLPMISPEPLGTPLKRELNSLPSTSGLSSNSSGLSAAKNRIGRSVLVSGTIDGRIRVQKLWHSAIMMQLEQLVEFDSCAIAQHGSQIEPSSSLATGAVTQMSVLPAENALNEIKLPILAAFAGDRSTLVHGFTVSLCTSQTDTHEAAASWQKQVMESTNRLFLGLVNKKPLVKPEHDWLSQIPVRYNTPQPFWLMTDPSKTKEFVTSMASMPNSNLVLMTFRPSEKALDHPKSSQCVLFSRDPDEPGTALTYIAQIKPLMPDPPGEKRALQAPIQPVAAKGYYTDMLARAGVHSPESESSLRSYDMTGGRARIGDHTISCGGVTWGNKKDGRYIGAFLYQPASLLGEGAAVALFEIVI